MSARLNLTDEERRERKRAQYRAGYARFVARGGNEERNRKRRLRGVHDIWGARADPPAEVLAERDRVYALERDPIAEILGDPRPGRRAIDQKEDRTCV
jgi:hypothetical protein